MTGDGHHERHRVAALSLSTPGNPWRRGEGKGLDLTGG